MFSEESKLVNIIVIVVALGFIVLGFYLAASGFRHGNIASSVGGLLGIMVCFAIAGTFLAPLISVSAGNWFGDFFFYRRIKLKKAPELIAPLEGLIREEKYTEAAEKIQAILFRDFMDITARELLFNLYYDHLKDKNKALEICLDYFNHPGHESNDKTASLLLAMSDLLPEPQAVEWLQKELKRGKYSKREKTVLETRLNAFDEETKPV